MHSSGLRVARWFRASHVLCIFSFHPFVPSRIDASGNENRSVRAGLTGIVKPYDAATHPSSRYSFYRPTP
jgi:hypothetical protein